MVTDDMTTQLTCVKTLHDSDEAGRVGGYLVVWGDADTRDLQGEYFTPTTDFALDWYDERPMLYQHGLDGNLKAAVIGRIDHLRVDETGIWAEAQLDMHKRYVRAVQRLVEKGVLHWSSGSVSHLVEVTDEGQIKRWPLVEGSLTPTPAEPRLTDVRTLKSAYETLGMTVHPALMNAHDTEKTQPENTVEKENPPMQPTQPASPVKKIPLASQDDARPRITVSSEYDPLNAADLCHGDI
ncbi:MAG: HK97 family phage prohead protease [Chloroflexota bacterium]